MPVKLVFLGRLADFAGLRESEAPAPLDWGGLLAALPEPLAKEAGSDRVRLAVNGRVLSDKLTLAAAEGDEIALLPPVSGG